MTEIKRCDNKSCGNHTGDDKCRCSGVYLIGGMCSGYRRVLVDAVSQAQPTPVLVHDKIVGRCRVLAASGDNQGGECGDEEFVCVVSQGVRIHATADVYSIEPGLYC